MMDTIEKQKLNVGIKFGIDQPYSIEEGVRINRDSFGCYTVCRDGDRGVMEKFSYSTAEEAYYTAVAMLQDLKQMMTAYSDKYEPK